MKIINKFKSYMNDWRDKEDIIETLIYFKVFEGERLDILLVAIMNKIDNPLESNLLVPNGLTKLLVKNFPETSYDYSKQVRVKRFKRSNKDEL